MSELAPGSAIGPFPYRTIRLLGRRQGAMSDVYLASVGEVETDEAPNLVVLKIVREEAEHSEFYRETLENEVDRLRRLKHPGIVRLFPIQKQGLRNLPYMAQSDLPGRPWFSVMEYLAGGSLADLLKQQKRLDIGFALEIARSLAITLDYLHHLQQVHLDLKPENVLFREPPRPRVEVQPVLIDFGISRHAGQAGLEAGTIQWSSPERILGNRGNDPPENAARPNPAMDIYALGLILYQMIAGRLPYEGRTRKSITTAILRGELTAPSEYQPLVKPELDRLIMLMLARDPAQRPSADEVAIALEELSIRLSYRPRYGYGVGENKPAPAPEKKRSGLLGRLAVAAMAALLIAQTALMVYWRPWIASAANNGQSTPAPVVTPVPQPAVENPVAAPATNTPEPLLTSTPVYTPTPASATPAIVTPETPTAEPTSTKVQPHTATPTPTAAPPTRTPTPLQETPVP